MDFFDTKFGIPTSLEVAAENAIRERFKTLTMPGLTPPKLLDPEHAQLSAEQGFEWTFHVLSVIMHCKVASADFVLIDKTPMQRVLLRVPKRGSRKAQTIRVSPDSLVLDLMWKRNHNDVFGSFLVEMAQVVASVIPAERMAILRADMANACAAAALDPKKLAPIQARIDQARVADRERFTAQIRNLIRKNDGLLSEKDIVKIWRECIVEEIMES